MKTPQNIQPSFNDEISIADMIRFFKSHKKMILIFVIIGSLLGGLYANFKAPVYKGSVLISLPKIAGAFAVTPKVTLSKINLNSYYSEETFLNCNPHLDKGKNIEENIPFKFKAAITKDGDLIEISMEDKNKTIIKNCLNSVFNDIYINENKIIDPLIQSKNNELKLAEEKLKNAEQFKIKLNDRQVKELKTNGESFAVVLLYTNMVLSNSSEINQILTEINKIKTDLASRQIKPVQKEVPLNIEKKSLHGALIGLFLGLCLGILLALIKEMKV